MQKCPGMKKIPKMILNVQKKPRVRNSRPSSVSSVCKKCIQKRGGNNNNKSPSREYLAENEEKQKKKSEEAETNLLFFFSSLCAEGMHAMPTLLKKGHAMGLLVFPQKRREFSKKD